VIGDTGIYGTILARRSLGASSSQSALLYLMSLRLGRNAAYATPFIEAIEPASGSLYGQTRLTLTGHHFPSAAHIWRMSLGAEQECGEVRSVDADMMTCLTSLRGSVTATGEGGSPLTFQSLSHGLVNSLSAASATFTYTEPPVIYVVSPASGGPGTRVVMHGAHLG
jgi:hypothetical protein